MSIIDLLGQPGGWDKLYGVACGVVTNIQDPEGLNRVKVKIPRLSGDDESNWARVATFMAGNGRGAYFLPEVDDEVLVAFEFGDVNLPYVIGALWNGIDKAPVTANSKNDLRVIKSRSGHLIRLNDKDGESSIEIIDRSGNNSIRIETKSNKITICSDQDIALTAPKGKVMISAREVEIKSSAAMTVEAGSNLEQKASGKIVMKGATIDLN